MSSQLVLICKLIAVVAVAGVVGVAIVVVALLIGHEILVRVYGDNLAPIDDTLPMQLSLWIAYLAGVLSALVIITIGWQRFVPRR